MSSPRYRPRDFLMTPRDFGRRITTEWRAVGEDKPSRLTAQLTAAQIQHRFSYGVREMWLPRSPEKKLTNLAEALEMPYTRLQRVLSGHAVMQLEDLGRLYAHIGPKMELWFLSGKHARIAQMAASLEQREGQVDPRDRSSR